MAMLAEPRRRKKYNLCPRGKALYEDDTRFGTKMLEKMGWSKGRGLGANEDGSQEFVRVRFKNDAEGLGYENRDDQWTVHEEGFNGLLKELNGGSAADTTAVAENENASASEDESRPMGFGFKPAPTEEEPKSKSLKENISGVSLEEASKTSKARVHYKKFTRGKDLSQYSEKDLANIFGKKAADETVGAVLQETAAEEKAAEEEAKEVNPNFAGVQTVSTGLSVNDYFKLKMEALKNRANGNAAASEPVLSNGADEEDKNTEPEKPEVAKEVAIKPEQAEVEEMQPDEENKPKRAEMEATEPEETKKSNPVENKKKLKLDKEVAFKPEQAEDEPDPVKKKKKSKRTEIDPVEADQIEENKPKRAKMEATEPEEKKKKKSKHTEESLPQGKPESAATEPEGKKRKLKFLDDSPQAKMSIIEPNKNLQETAATEPAEKKKKKSKRIAIDPVVPDHIEEIKPKRAKMEAAESEDKKKNSKHANNNLQQTAATEPPEKKKKKSKHTEESLPQGKTESAVTEPEGKKKKLKFLDDISPQAKMSILEPKTKDKEKKKGKKSKHVEDTTLMEPSLQPSQEKKLKMAAEEPARKKKKNKKSKQEPEEQPEEAKPLKQKKDKSKESKNKQDDIIIDAQIAIEKKGKKSKNQKIAMNNVSAESEDSSLDNVELLDTDKYLTHEELVERRDSYNICTISSFCAEKFHIVNLKAFQNASLYQITGYGFDENNFQLNVVERLEDASRIVNLWEGRTNKYDKSANLKLTKQMKKENVQEAYTNCQEYKDFRGALTQGKTTKFGCLSV